MVFRMANVPFLYRFETQNGAENEKEVPTFGLSFQLFLTLSASAGFLWFFCKLRATELIRNIKKWAGGASALPLQSDSPVQQTGEGHA